MEIDQMPSGIELIEPTQLYNLLNQETTYPCLSDPVYMLLLDARTKNDYNESHIITARIVLMDNTDEYVVPYDSELECKTHVVIYDSKTSSLTDDDRCDTAAKCARKMWEMGSRNHVKILNGGYEKFSAIYPFLRTKKMIYMPRELDCLQTYPIEVIPGHLYLGNWHQGNVPYMQKDLKITGHINCSKVKDTFFSEIGANLLFIQDVDTPTTNIYSLFQTVCDFIDIHFHNDGAVVVYSTLGISRSAAFVIAYVMYYNNWTLEETFKFVKSCCSKICPNKGFLEQLSQWDRDLKDKVVTNYGALTYAASVDTITGASTEELLQYQYDDSSVMNVFDLPED